MPVPCASGMNYFVSNYLSRIIPVFPRLRRLGIEGGRRKPISTLKATLGQGYRALNARAVERDFLY